MNSNTTIIKFFKKIYIKNHDVFLEVKLVNILDLKDNANFFYNKLSKYNSKVTAS